MKTMLRHGLCLVIATALGPPLPAAAQQHERGAFSARIEYGPAKLAWWARTGTVLQGGVGWTPTRSLPLVLDFRASRFRPPAGDGRQVPFYAVGLEWWLFAPAAVSPFLAGHAGVGSDEDGPIAAVTGTAGAAIRAGSMGRALLSVMAAPDGSWAATFGWAIGAP